MVDKKANTYVLRRTYKWSHVFVKEGLPEEVISELTLQ